MKSRRVLVCGSRAYEDRDKINHVLDAYHARLGPYMLVIIGGATGADELARQWAVSRKVDHMVLYAKWELEHRGAGAIRNRRMARQKPKLVLAFHQDIDNSRGTADMIGVAKKLDIKFKVFR